MANIFVRLKDKGGILYDSEQGVTITGTDVLEVEKTDLIRKAINGGALEEVPKDEAPALIEEAKKKKEELLAARAQRADEALKPKKLEPTKEELEAEKIAAEEEAKKKAEEEAAAAVEATDKNPAKVESPYTHFTKEQLNQELDKRGIERNPKATNKELEELLLKSDAELSK